MGVWEKPQPGCEPEAPTGGVSSIGMMYTADEKEVPPER